MAEQLFQQIDKSILKLFGGVFHDLNNIFGSIVTNLTFLISKVESTYPNFPYKEDLKNLLKFSERSTLLVDNMLTIIKNSSEPNFIPLTIKEILNEIIFLLKDMYKNTDIKIKLKTSSSLPKIYGDGNLLYQAFLNICINGIESMEHSSKEKVLKISVKEEKEYIKVTIQDTGRGIEKKIKERIFEPFFSTKSNSKFKGLGLYIVKSVIESHKGKIEVESILNKGTKFKIYLPICKLQFSYKSDKKSITTFNPKGKILIIDNDKTFHKYITTFLLKENFETLSAYNAQDAFKILTNENNIDLILLDIFLPEANGYEILKKIRLNNNKIKVIVITAYSIDNNLLPLFKLGVNDVLQKPFKNTELLNKIQNLIYKE